MKSYIKLIITVLLALISLYSIAQDSEIKKKKISFKVAGKCEMCKARIEESLDIKGIKFAEWNQETRQCKVVFNPQKIKENEIHTIVTKIGHDTDKIKATDEDYNNLHGCCHYNRLGEENHKH